VSGGNGSAEAPVLTPLDMARNCAAKVAAMAREADADPMSAHVRGMGNHGHATAQLAGNLALVSIAEDLHRLLAIMTGQVPAGVAHLEDQ
jgi:hypothetical protein